MGRLCEKCDGRCCRYVAVEIDEPTTKGDFDDVRWYTAHRGVSVFVEDKRWHINFSSRCNYLTQDNQCEAYESRPRICRDHDMSDCEGPEGEYRFELELRTPAEVEAYYENVVKPKRGKKRKKGKKK